MTSDAAIPRRAATPVFLWTSLPLLVLYASTVAPTVTGEDSGELIAAAHTLGVAHPPGYPLWVLLTKGFQLLGSGVSVAHASNLASSVATAAACGLLAVLALRLGFGALLSVTTGLLAGLAHEIWNHATITEVYPLALLLFVASILAFLRWREEPSLKRWFALTFLLGAGVSHHPLLLLFGPVFFVAALAALPRHVLRPRALLVGAAGLAFPFLAYAQVLVAAGSDPVMSWGVRPEVSSLVAHWNRDIYGVGPAKTSFTAAKAFAQAAAFGRCFADNVTLPGSLLGVVGLVLLAARSGFGGRLVAALAVAGSAGLVLLLRSDLEREDLFASRVFLMPAELLLVVGIGSLLREAVRLLPDAARPRATLASLLIPLVAAAASFSAHDRSSYRWSENYGRAILEGCPKNALLFPGGDTSTFPLVHLQYVEDVRRDVLVLDRSGTIERDEAAAVLPAEHRPAAYAASREEILELLARRSGRPVVSLRPERGSEDLVSEPCGFGFVLLAAGDRAGREAAAARQRDFVAALKFSNESTPTVADHTSDLIRSHLAQVRAADAFARGRPGEAAAFAAAALAASAGIKETLNNVGSLLADHGEAEAAVTMFRDALAIRADYALARRNLAVVLRGLGRVDEAVRTCAVGLAIDPTDAALFREGASAASAAKDGPALKALCAVRIKAAPSDPEPHRRLGAWAEEREGSSALARAHYEAAARLSPEDEGLKRKLRDLPDADGQAAPEAPEAALRPFAAVDLALRRGPYERSFPRSPRLRREEADGFGRVSGAEQLAHLRAQLTGAGWTDPSAGLPSPTEPRDVR